VIAVGGGCMFNSCNKIARTWRLFFPPMQSLPFARVTHPRLENKGFQVRPKLHSPKSTYNRNGGSPCRSRRHRSRRLSQRGSLALRSQMGADLFEVDCPDERHGMQDQLHWPLLVVEQTRERPEGRFQPLQLLLREERGPERIVCQARES
jgi:hypothetical protein